VKAFRTWKVIDRFLIDLEARLAVLALALPLLGISGLATYLAAITAWARSWGPLGWLLCGLGVALLLAMFAYITALFLESRSRAALNEKRALSSTRINILQPSFEDQIIHQEDLWSFQHQQIGNKRFHKCRFVGPMVVLLNGKCFIDRLAANDCNFIEISKGGVAHGLVAFFSCHFTDCEFDCVTFLVTETDAAQMRSVAEKGMYWLPRPK
jgi:hypothetical protein